MKPDFFIHEFSGNRDLFEHLLAGTGPEERLWKQAPEKWCLLEILCHLYDEEREDFRARIQHVFTQPDQPLPPIAPEDWVTERKYTDQDFDLMLKKFLQERDASINWLRSLQDPPWDNAYIHPEFGEMKAKMFLANWLAHDYLHIRQITKLKYDYLKYLSGEDLNYAGNW